MSGPYGDLRILVTGARGPLTPEQEDHVRAVLRRTASAALVLGKTVVVVEGRCPKGGVALVAQRWAEETPGVFDEGHPADWKRYGRGAGMIRNQHMVNLGADICLAFPNARSRGTWDCLRKAADTGVIGRVYPI